MIDKFDQTLVTSLAQFTAAACFEDLSPEGVEESKRLLLDGIASALGSVHSESGKIALKYARMLAGPAEATIIGGGEKVGRFGAAFANGELINALDHDAVTIVPPGHVSPYVMPATLAAGEMVAATGKELLLANALAHEISVRVGRALSYYLDNSKGKTEYSTVFGHSACVFGGTAAIGKLMSFNPEKLSNALGIVGLTAPVQAVAKWSRTTPSPTVKYTPSGVMAQTELTAALLAEMGHRGDPTVFEGDYGFWRFTGSTRWKPTFITDGLGELWRYVPVNRYKPYPTGAYAHAALDAFKHIIEEHDLAPREIERVKIFAAVWSEAGYWPMIGNRRITNQSESQFSQPYAFSLIAHRITPGPQWHDRATMHDERINAFMEKVVFANQHEYPDALKSGGEGYPAGGSVEVVARGKVFVESRMLPKGEPSTPESRMTTEELADKFRHNAERVLRWDQIEPTIEMILRLESVGDVRELMEKLGGR